MRMSIYSEICISTPYLHIPRELQNLLGEWFVQYESSVYTIILLYLHVNVYANVYVTLQSPFPFPHCTACSVIID